MQIVMEVTKEMIEEAENCLQSPGDDSWWLHLAYETLQQMLKEKIVEEYK